MKRDNEKFSEICFVEIIGKKNPKKFNENCLLLSGVWQVPMVMWQDLNGGRCSMGDACSNPADADGVTKMIMKNFERHYTTNRYELIVNCAHTQKKQPEKNFVFSPMKI